MWCWWCCHPIEGVTLEMPYKYEERTKKFFTTGHFCSWSCMKAYAIDKYGCTQGARMCGNMQLMRKRMFGVMGHVDPAPNRYTLDVFGGDVTIEEFRKGLNKDTTPHKEVDSAPFRDRTIPIVATPERNVVEEASGEGLALKREKPLKRTHNNLESALGLVIKPKQLSQV